jgi:hypothetical protein
MFRYVIRHNHVWIFNIPQRTHDLVKIHITFVGIHLLKVTPTASDVSHVNAYPGSNLPPVPDEACHPFRLKTATYSGQNLPL